MKQILYIIIAIATLTMNAAAMQDPYEGAENEAAVKAILPYLEKWDDCGIIDPSFSAYSVNKNGKWGLIDKQGEVIIEPQYKEVFVNRNQIRILDTNDKYGYLDAEGNMIVEPKYDFADVGFSNGLAVVGRDFGYTVIDMTGIEIMPLQPEMLYHDSRSEFYYYKTGNKVTVLDLKGNTAFEGEYDYFSMHSKDAITIENNGLQGVININKDIIIESEYEQIILLYNLKIEDGVWVAIKNGKLGYFDIEGNPIGKFGWDDMSNFLDGNTLLIKENGKYGLMDRRGSIVLEPIYGYLIIEDNSIILGKGSKLIEASLTDEPLKFVEKDMSLIKTPEVDYLVSIGLLKGDDDGNLNLYDTVTRAEFVAMLARLGNWDIADNKSEFSDVNQHWAKNYIIRAANKGLLNGYGDGTFRPDDSITMNQAFLIMLRLLGVSDEYIKETMPVIAGEYDVHFLAYRAKIAPEGNYYRRESATMENIAKILYNYLHTDMTAEKLCESRPMIQTYLGN